MLTFPQLHTLVEQRLMAELSPTFLEIEDESHFHQGHAGAKNGGKHIKIKISSAQFAHKNILMRHRLVYAALANFIGKEIHAVRVDASM